MDVNTFWKLIDRARTDSNGDMSKQANLLVEELVQLPLTKILAYETIMDDLLDTAYDAALWDAAYIIGCGCSDDGFEDFRGWLIAQGKDVYEQALADPENLVDRIAVTEMGRESFILSIFIKAYEKKTGQVFHMTNRKRPVLKGKLWKEEDKKLRFPKLAAKFGDCDQRDSMWFES